MPDDGPKTERELTPAEQRELERALASPMKELPENKPKGLLGEPGLNVSKTDTFEPDLNSGISQENDTPVIWLAVFLGYLLFFVPGFVILWMSKRIPRRTKIVASVVMGAGIVALVYWARTRGLV